MANAIKRITIARGHDVTQGYSLVGFGGAAGQHVCLVADALGVDEILLHPLAGVLSAYGMGLARPSAMRERTLGLMLDGDCTAKLAVVETELAAHPRAVPRSEEGRGGNECVSTCTLRWLPDPGQKIHTKN